MKKYTLKRINTQKIYHINIQENVINIEIDNQPNIFHFQKDSYQIKAESSSSDSELKYVAIEALFSTFPNVTSITLNHEAHKRETFFQRAHLWSAPSDLNFPLEEWTETKEVHHPKRPAFKANTPLYARYVEAINATVTIRVIAESDLDLFHEWHNQARVAEFWELAKSKDEIKDYIQKGLNDPHQMPVIVEINNEPAAYFEIYWTREDRLGPYYESDAYDRGFHLLVGNTKFLGFKNTDALLKSVSHFVFLDDPRTRRIMGEPRHDNEKMLKYVDTFKAWRKVKIFDFPHKRAVLLECCRELLFKGHYL